MSSSTTLADLHESVVSRILSVAGPRSVAAMRVVLKAARRATDFDGAWRSLRFSEHDASLRFADIARLLGFADGKVEEFRLASGPAAEAAERQKRFLTREARFNVPMPHTLDSAEELARLLSGVRVLSLDERSSAVGGLTDALAFSLASASGDGEGASRLRELDAAFRPHSWAAELFTDAGLVALARAAARWSSREGEEEVDDEDDDGDGDENDDSDDDKQQEEPRGLVRLRLHGAGGITDSGLSAVAVCSFSTMTEVELSGYSELVGDRGISSLVAAAANDDSGDDFGRGGLRARRTRSRRRRSGRATFGSSSSTSESSDDASVSSSSLSSSSSSSSLEEDVSTSSPFSSSRLRLDRRRSPVVALDRRRPPVVALERLLLDPRMPNATDAGLCAVVAGAPRLRSLRLPSRCTDATLLSASASDCRLALEEVDASACVGGVTSVGASALVRACPRLRSLRLPPGVVVGDAAASSSLS